MDRKEYVCNQMYKQHALLRKDSWTDADKLEYMELNIAPYSRYWRMGMKKALKHAIKLLREEEAKADHKDEPTGYNLSPVEDEPTISKMEQVDEPKTQTKTQNSNLTFEKRCKGCKHYKLTCDLFSEVCKYEPTTEDCSMVEPQTDCGDFADRLAYERGIKHAWEVAQKVFDSTVTFYEAEDVAKQIDKDINVRSKGEPQTDCAWK